MRPGTARIVGAALLLSGLLVAGAAVEWDDRSRGPPVLLVEKATDPIEGDPTASDDLSPAAERRFEEARANGSTVLDPETDAEAVSTFRRVEYVSTGYVTWETTVRRPYRSDVPPEQGYWIALAHLGAVLVVLGGAVASVGSLAVPRWRSLPFVPAAGYLSTYALVGDPALSGFFSLPTTVLAVALSVPRGDAAGSVAEVLAVGLVAAGAVLFAVFPLGGGLVWSAGAGALVLRRFLHATRDGLYWPV